MHDCVIRLLRYSHDEDNLECLTRLLTTIGQDIDNEKSRVGVIIIIVVVVITIAYIAP